MYTEHERPFIYIFLKKNVKKIDLAHTLDDVLTFLKPYFVLFVQ